MQFLVRNESRQKTPKLSCEAKWEKKTKYTQYTQHKYIYFKRKMQKKTETQVHEMFMNSHHNWLNINNAVAYIEGCNKRKRQKDY